MSEIAADITVDVPDPIEELRTQLKQQQEIIVKQTAALKDLTRRIGEAEKLQHAAAPQAAAAPAAPKKSPQDEAYEALLKEMGLSPEAS